MFKFKLYSNRIYGARTLAEPVEDYGFPWEDALGETEEKFRTDPFHRGQLDHLSEELSFNVATRLFGPGDSIPQDDPRKSAWMKGEIARYFQALVILIDTNSSMLRSRSFIPMPRNDLRRIGLSSKDDSYHVIIRDSFERTFKKLLDKATIGVEENFLAVLNEDEQVLLEISFTDVVNAGIGKQLLICVTEDARELINNPDFDEVQVAMRRLAARNLRRELIAKRRWRPRS